jgi:hypothetical protein
MRRSGYERVWVDIV